MSDEEAVDVELEDVVEPAAPLDFAKLDADMVERKARMVANTEHRGDPELTFTAWGQALRVANSEQAQAEALRVQADVRLADYAVRGVGERAQKKTLAYKIKNGDFDA